MAREKRAKKKEQEEFANDDEMLTSLINDMNGKFSESTMILEGTTKGQINLLVPSGNPALDKALGGGYPAGRVVEIYGPESNGKTTVALHALAETQKMGGIAVFLDTEHALDKRRAKDIGVDITRLMYAQPETMELTFKYVEQLIEKVKEKQPDRLITVVWDSVAATPTESEVEGEYGDAVMGIHARIMSQAFRKITKQISEHNILFICINQIRDKMNVSYGEKSDTFGGRALKFYSSIRLDVRKVGTVKRGEKAIGIQCKATTKKNKVAPPFEVAEFNILFDPENAGMDSYSAVLENARDAGMFGSKKGWFEYQDKNWRMGDLMKHFKENDDEWQVILDTYMSL